MIRTDIFLFCILLSISVSGILTADNSNIAEDTQTSNTVPEESNRPALLGNDEKEVIVDQELNNQTLEKETETAQPKQPKTWQDALREARSGREPVPGSHFDENYHVIVDDPEVYQEALEKENAKLTGNEDFKTDSSEPEYEFKLFSWETLIGGIIGAFILFSSILLCQLNDSFKKKKGQE